MKPYNLLEVLLVAVSVAVGVEAVNKLAARSSRTGRASTGNTRKFIIEVEPVKKPLLSSSQLLTLAESRHDHSDTPTPHET
jgi:Tfp pilus assembly protein PilV